ncbi:SNF2 family N-terminal domain-containing protein [Xylariomycetidae sp. FL2044]|nr:SNF2 family N-terminal domain-containing protein [Xylariomycetidae sp. FL2044]
MNVDKGEKDTARQSHTTNGTNEPLIGGETPPSRGTDHGADGHCSSLMVESIMENRAASGQQVKLKQETELDSGNLADARMKSNSNYSISSAIVNHHALDLPTLGQSQTPLHAPVGSRVSKDQQTELESLREKRLLGFGKRSDCLPDADSEHPVPNVERDQSALGNQSQCGQETTEGFNGLIHRSLHNINESTSAELHTEDREDAEKPIQSNKTKRQPKPKAKDARTAHARINEARANAKGDSNKGRTSRPRKRKHGQVSTGLEAFGSFDAISHHNQNINKLPQFEITATTRTEYHKQILARLPKDADTAKVKSELNELFAAATKMGNCKCRPRGLNWALDGMVETLYPHQLLALDFMLGRELSTSGPKGGLIADTMGMGKTAEGLACVVANPPDQEDLAQRCKLNLWLSPRIAHDQLHKAARKFCSRESINKVLIYDAKALKRQYRDPRDIMDHLLEHDLIIATYEDLNAEIDHEVGLRLIKDNSSLDDLEPQEIGELGNLFKIKWYRVFFDEAHCIRNPSTRRFVACRCLEAKYRWPLTGTPIHNSVADLYSYLSLIRDDRVGSRKDFVNAFVKDDKRLTELDEMMGQVMLRRTQRDKYLGQTLFDVPVAHRAVITIQFTPEEKVFYMKLEELFRNAFERETKSTDGNLETNDRNRYLANILRLRQLTCHPYLLEHMTRSLPDMEALETLLQSLDATSDENPLYDMIQGWLQNCKDLPEALDHAISREGHHEPCKTCSQPLENPIQIKGCMHIFCTQCILEHQDQERHKGIDSPQCPFCHRDTKWVPPDKHVDDTQSEEQSLVSEELDNRYRRGSGRPSKRKAKAPKRQPRRGEDIYCRKPKMHFSPQSFKWMDNNPDQPTLLGAKLHAVEGQVLSWLNEAPLDKIIIFTQFSMGAIIIGSLLYDRHIKFSYYIGGVAQDHRDKVVADFEENPEIKVMIISIRSGSLALNLTCANRAICVEPWWNRCVEDQAFGRVFRLGQKKETHLVRFIVEGTIDQRMQAMQDDKANNSARTLKDELETEQAITDHQIGYLLGRPSWDANQPVDNNEDEAGSPADDTESDVGSE